MTLAAGFLRAIIENPADDTPRLIFADWLEEQGDPRGEFIRCQIMAPRLEEEVEEWIRTPHNQPGGNAQAGGRAGAALAEAQALRRRERALLKRHRCSWEGDVRQPIAEKHVAEALETGRRLNDWREPPAIQALEFSAIRN